MKIFQHKDYNQEFPELFNWGLVDSPTIWRIAEIIIERIKEDMDTDNRNEVPGLRVALRAIAIHTEI